MNRFQLRKKWIAALRSGRYKQGRGYLKRRIGDKTTYCCLGVLCQISKEVQSKKPDSKGVIFFGKNKDEGYLPDILAKKLKMHHGGMITGLCTDGNKIFNTGSLITANDDGYSFTEIADALEQHPEWFFEDVRAKLCCSQS